MTLKFCKLKKNEEFEEFHFLEELNDAIKKNKLHNFHIKYYMFIHIKYLYNEIYIFLSYFKSVIFSFVLLVRSVHFTVNINWEKTTLMGKSQH